MTGKYRPPVVYTVGALMAALDNNRAFMALHKCFLLDECRIVVPSIVRVEVRRRGDGRQPTEVLKACKTDWEDESETSVLHEYMIDFVVGSKVSRIDAMVAATAVAHRAVVVTTEVNALELMWAVDDVDRPMAIITI
ncbi:hypothetical protein [Kutzneria sp. CA-103260]|uniref:hypothetical protein n=1 Tax=Kutzneria sp. CA-103260 TaxID=2802641 RepID=UPI001BA477F0|nr:hypothetical protein [Kutzneria sp. CA-103260]QUQ69511.1 hypothetical protein JJ691_72690 [Kutzneria sp. CA-103260]